MGYERLGNSRMSIENYEEAKKLLTDPSDADELRAVCNNVGNSYESIGVSLYFGMGNSYESIGVSIMIWGTRFNLMTLGFVIICATHVNLLTPCFDRSAWSSFGVFAIARANCLNILIFMIVIYHYFHYQQKFYLMNYITFYDVLFFVFGHLYPSFICY